MKSFLEEYGFSILAAIVVILLIMMISPVGVAIRGSLESIVLKFDGSVSNSLTGYKIDFEGSDTSAEQEPDYNPETQFLSVYHANGGKFDNGKNVCYEVYDYSTNSVVEMTCDDPYSAVKDGKTVGNFDTVVDLPDRWEGEAVYPISLEEIRIYDLYGDGQGRYLYFSESMFVHNSTDSPDIADNYVYPLRLKKEGDAYKIDEWIEPGPLVVFESYLTGYELVTRNFHMNVPQPENFEAGQLFYAYGREEGRLSFEGFIHNPDSNPCSETVLYGWVSYENYILFDSVLDWNTDGYWYATVDNFSEVRKKYNSGDSCPIPQ